MDIGGTNLIKYELFCAVANRNQTVEHADIGRTVRTDGNGTVAVVPVSATAGKNLVHRFAGFKVDSGEIPCNGTGGNLGSAFSRVEINEAVIRRELRHDGAGRFSAFPNDFTARAVLVHVDSRHARVARRILD